MTVKHDIHCHTLFSSCCYDTEATMAAFAAKALELGHTVIGVSNHLWDEKVPGANKWYKGQCINYGFEAKYAIPSDTKGVRFLFGVESEYCGRNKTLGMTAETAAKFDYVLIPHTHTHMRGFVIDEMPEIREVRKKLAERAAAAFPELKPELTDSMITPVNHRDLFPMVENATEKYHEYLRNFMFESFESLLEHPEFKVMAAHTSTLIAHPFSPCGEPVDERPDIMNGLDRDRLYADFEKAAKMNVALDVNIGTYKFPENGYDNDSMVAVMRIAKAAGCRFGFGTDSHTVSGLGNIREGDIISEAIGITENDLVDIVR